MASPLSNSPLPKWKRLVKDITDKIIAGEYKPGDKLPSTSQLCEAYDISAIVVRNAVIELKAEKLIVTVPGVGMFVAPRTNDISR